MSSRQPSSGAGDWMTDGLLTGLPDLLPVPEHSGDLAAVTVHGICQTCTGWLDIVSVMPAAAFLLVQVALSLTGSTSAFSRLHGGI